MSGPAVRPVPAAAAAAAAAAQPLDDPKVVLHYYPPKRKKAVHPKKRAVANADAGAGYARGSGRGTVVNDDGTSLVTGSNTTNNSSMKPKSRCTMHYYRRIYKNKNKHKNEESKKEKKNKKSSSERITG
eukprot:CAMPEP_0170778176 /NCGR_PEP_ID=MMETSP0733-20121128/12236_1 /TAXON_ID=186038 /ORGANISM="Fragilariopsis kerguelensis, Strain L26-C5" /LENGTH=128 /DNA_ID=CAMNT_0011121551 /DNA_START=150 /DNA_END=534 /DNA_ORIENTATION=+